MKPLQTCKVVSHTEAEYQGTITTTKVRLIGNKKDNVSLFASVQKIAERSRALLPPVQADKRKVS